MKRDFVLGVDCGRHTGLAVWRRSAREFVALETLDFWSAYDFIKENYPPDVAEVVIEVPNAKRFLYARQDKKPDAARYRERMAANVGSNRREAELLAERFEFYGYEVKRVQPVKAKKWTHEEFVKFTKWPGRRSNEHERDAARLVVGS